VRTQALYRALYALLRVLEKAVGTCPDCGAQGKAAEEREAIAARNVALAWYRCPAEHTYLGRV
jgi:hypothetical protein